MDRCASSPSVRRCARCAARNPQTRPRGCARPDRGFAGYTGRRDEPAMNPKFLSTANRLCLVVAAWIVLVCNLSFWRLFFAVQGTSPRALLFAASLAVALLGLNLLLL